MGLQHFAANQPLIGLTQRRLILISAQGVSRGSTACTGASADGRQRRRPGSPH